MLYKDLQEPEGKRDHLKIIKKTAYLKRNDN